VKAHPNWTDPPPGEPPPRPRGRGERPDAPVLRLPVEPRAEARPAGADLGAALDGAAAAVCDGWGQTVGDGLDQATVAAHVGRLCAAARRAAAGEPPAIGTFAPTVPVRRILDLVRQALLDHVAALDVPADPAELVALLRGVERVQAEIDRDAAQRFATRLSGPDGLELLVDVAHDLRSPLTSILFLAETLHAARSGPVNAVQERQLGLIYSAAFGLSSLANDVIELARGGERLVDQEPLAFSVTDIMQSVRDIVRVMAEEKGLEIRLQVPEVDSRVGQPAALQRVLLNLTTNALKFTDVGAVELSAKQLGRSRIEFSVRDSGRGMTPAVMASLFDPVRRRYRPGEYTFSSSGLGLTICRKLVTMMGGELQVESAPGAGTRFYFTLDLPLAAKL